MSAGSPFGTHRVLAREGIGPALPQQAQQLDASPDIASDEVRIGLEVLNLDAASYRQLAQTHTQANGETDGLALRQAVLEIVASRGKMQNPVTGSGGMLIGTVEAVGERSTLGLSVGMRVATLVSLSLTPLQITDGLRNWDGLSEQVPATGHAILFGRSIAAELPADLDPLLGLMVMDVCGAPALVSRVVQQYRQRGVQPTVAVLGAAGKSGSLSLAAARSSGAADTVAVVPHRGEYDLLNGIGLAEHVVIADARDPLELAQAVQTATGPADITVVCVDVPGCEQPAIMATAQGGTVIFFSMATSFSAAALGAEGLAADVTMLIGNGYVPGHAAYALSLIRDDTAVRGLFESRLRKEQNRVL